jgi:hypothetical protein
MAAKPLEDRIATCRRVAQGISEAVERGQLLTSESPDGRLVLEVASSRPVAASYALGHLLGINMQEVESREAFDGRLTAGLSKLGVSEQLVQNTRSILEALHVEHTQVLGKLKSDGATAKTDLDSLREASQVDNEKRRAEFAESEGKRTQEFATKLDEQKAEFENLKAAFAEHMKLKAPVQYWTRSKWWHRLTALVFGLLSVGWGTVVGYEAVQYYRVLLERKPVLPQAAAAGASSQQTLPLWEIGLLLLLITLAVWLIRVLVRVTLSNLHQAAEAASRATMTEAYLALIADGKGLPEKDRILVLTTVFRPMSTGLIKDGDGMPPSLIELLSRIVGGK